MKGQIEFGETIMVVIVLVFFLVIGIVFYYNVSANQIRNEMDYREDIDAIVLGKRVLALPEIECSVIQGGSCIDYLKVSLLADMIGRDTNVKSYYGSIFGYSTITIIPLDDQDAPLLSRVVLYDDKLKGNVTVSQQFLFTTVYDPLRQITNLAYMNITRYTVVRS